MEQSEFEFYDGRVSLMVDTVASQRQGSGTFRLDFVFFAGLGSLVSSTKRRNVIMTD